MLRRRRQRRQAERQEMAAGDAADVLQEGHFHSCTFQWTVRDFSKLDLTSRVYSNVYSLSIEEKSIDWRLFIADNDDKKYISLYLGLASTGLQVKANFTVAILDRDNKRCFERTVQSSHYFALDSFGFPSYISRHTLETEAARLLPNDKLTIVCEVNHGMKLRHLSVMAEHITNMWRMEEHSDVTLCVAEGKKYIEFKAHKAILSARSSVFRAMFSHDLTENKENRVEITDLDAKVVQNLMEYVYTGGVDNILVVAEQLLPAADKYELTELRTMCEEVLCSSLTTDNVAERLMLADLHSAADLQKAALEFTTKHCNAICDTEGWINLERNYPHLTTQAYRALAAKHMGEPPKKKAKH